MADDGEDAVVALLDGARKDDDAAPKAEGAADGGTGSGSNDDDVPMTKAGDEDAQAETEVKTGGSAPAAGAGAGAGAGADAATTGRQRSRAEFEGSGRRGDGGRGGKRRRKREVVAEEVDPKDRALLDRIEHDVRQSPDEKFLRKVLFDLVPRDLDRRARQVKHNVQESAELMRVVLDTLLMCVTELPHRLPTYAALTGLVAASETAFADAVVEAVGSALAEATASLHTMSIKLLLRFALELARIGLVSTATVVATLQDLAAIARDGDAPVQRREYATFLILITAIWEGDWLDEQCPAELREMLAACESVVDVVRALPHDPMRTWIDDTLLETSVPPRHVIAALWAAVQQQQEDSAERKWKLPFADRPYSKFEGQFKDLTARDLAKAALRDHDEELGYRLHPAETLVGDDGFASDKALAAAELQDATPADMAAARDMLHDMLITFHPFHQTLSRELRDLRSPFPVTFLIVETIIAQLLQVPSAPHSLVYYFALLADLCTTDRFQPSIGLAFLILFKHIEKMDDECKARLVDWIALHLSNYGYQWAWKPWFRAVDLPTHHPQRRFVSSVLEEAFRLGYWDRVRGVVPNELEPLMPPKASPSSRYFRDGAAEETKPTGGGKADEGQESRRAPRRRRRRRRKPRTIGAVSESDDSDASSDEGDDMHEEGVEEPTGDGSAAPANGTTTVSDKALAAQLRAKLAAKVPGDELETWLMTTIPDAAKRVTLLAHTIFIHGSRSYTHAYTLLTRYKGLLDSLFAEGDASSDGGGLQLTTSSLEYHFLSAISAVWANGAEAAEVLASLALSLGVVEAGDIINWVMQSNFRQGVFSIRVWKIVDNALAQTTVALGRIGDGSASDYGVNTASAASGVPNASDVDADAGAATNQEELWADGVSATRRAVVLIMRGIAKAMQAAESGLDNDRRRHELQALCSRMRQIARAFHHIVHPLLPWVDEHVAGRRAHDLFNSTLATIRAWKPRVFPPRPVLQRDAVPPVMAPHVLSRYCADVVQVVADSDDDA